VLGEEGVFEVERNLWGLRFAFQNLEIRFDFLRYTRVPSEAIKVLAQLEGTKSSSSFIHGMEADVIRGSS
jgi:hypothetical protein